MNMENARKLADCYFYYYSTCTKGDACNFRHEPEALGCESMCIFWQQGKCFDQHCKLRHMELRKNRKQIPCYWETQPGGCRKKHCSFLHKNPQARVDGIAPCQAGVPLSGTRDIQQQNINRETGEGPPTASASAGLHQGVASQSNQSTTVHGGHPANWQRQVMDPGMLRGASLEGQHAGMPPLAALNPMTPMAPMNTMSPLAAAYNALHPVDSLVVNFEEESDSESITGSPVKSAMDVEKHSIDLMRLEQIQEATAAFYSYDSLSSNLPEYPASENCAELKYTKRKLPVEYESMSLDELQGVNGKAKRKNLDDFRVLSLEEIRERKRRKVNRSASNESDLAIQSDSNSCDATNIDHFNIKNSVEMDITVSDSSRSSENSLAMSDSISCDTTNNKCIEPEIDAPCPVDSRLSSPLTVVQESASIKTQLKRVFSGVKMAFGNAIISEFSNTESETKGNICDADKNNIVSDLDNDTVSSLSNLNDMSSSVSDVLNNSGASEVVTEIISVLSDSVPDIVVSCTRTTSNS